MKKIQQSPALQKAFQDKIQQKQNLRHQDIYEKLGTNPLGHFVVGVAQFENWKNKVKGDFGEHTLAFLLSQLPQSWAMGKNIFLPTQNNKLTEIDLIIVGTKGIFLLEVKTWSGSFSAYKDRWKRRQGNQWVSLKSSPSEQSLYHQKAFQDWLIKQKLDIPPDVIIAPVVFPTARWIGAKECSVPILSSLSELNRLISQRHDDLTTVQIDNIVDALQQVQVPNTQLNRVSPPKSVDTSNQGSIPKPILKKRPNI